MNVECKSQSTKDIYQFHISNFLMKYKEPKQENILDYLNYLVIEKRYKPSSLNLAKYALIYYFTNILHQQITIFIPTIKREKILPKVVSKDIILKMIDILTNIKHKIIVGLLYSSGNNSFNLKPELYNNPTIIV